MRPPGEAGQLPGGAMHYVASTRNLVCHIMPIFITEDTGQAALVAGQALRQTCQAVRQTGRAVRQTGQAVLQAGQAVRQTSQAVRQTDQAVPLYSWLIFFFSIH